ncbi:alpha-ketoacid dehydrogenase subunit beta [Saccharolobus solfataricus]|uniref:2-oxoacid oxidoreductase (ferredoxin) n=2 Tax=Saccharolobus solfataricus TaxID=2287 RepID=Q97YF5_SACS2|nr:alpha-ketoacid dehydrogenase subunit beta [Saccharolobus solfataricus]AAK41604.1 Pyruvate dehydrogenase, beta subunit (lipoamide). (pdhB-1) [Saccharolobus solfataricus P2]QPG48948.1 alpha-ketoacid dehydrogenase subunit beta [Saccharolobus solfataricus]SAI85037.1 pyruvate dehydrogenase subunit beta [Saccharolobus solfataricus]
MKIRGIAQAIAEGIRQEMERNDRIVVLGEDVTYWGAVFGFTMGLFDKFGRKRVIDTPITEQTFMGISVGAASSGLHPVVSLMFVDFLGAGFDQMFNHMAKNYYMSGGQYPMPITVITAIGGGYGDSSQHSQVLYSLFAHLPGFKVIVPSTPYDAKGLTIKALRDNNPVIIFGHKLLTGLPFLPFEGNEEEVPEEPYEIEFGKAAIRKEGTDLTIISAGLMVHRSLKAAEMLQKEGISAEVIDVRTFVPLDEETIIKSARKTGRVLIVDEDYMSYGVTGEIAFRIQSKALKDLKVPISRLAVPDVPIPFSEPLENAVIPNVNTIYSEAKKLIQ